MRWTPGSHICSHQGIFFKGWCVGHSDQKGDRNQVSILSQVLKYSLLALLVDSCLKSRQSTRPMYWAPIPLENNPLY